MNRDSAKVPWRIAVGAGAGDGQPRCAVVGGRTSDPGGTAGTAGGLERARRHRMGGELHAGQRIRERPGHAVSRPGDQRGASCIAVRHHLFRDSTLNAEVLQIRFTDPDTAVAEVLLRLVGYAALPPRIGETAPGVLETRLVDVLQKIDGHWRIVFSQNTAIVPLPPSPAR